MSKKIRNLTSHAIQFMFKKEEDGTLDFLHIPEDMQQGYVIVDDKVWSQIEKQTRHLEVYNASEEVIAGITINGKQPTRTVLLGTGVFKQQSVVEHLLRTRQLEYVEDEGSSRSKVDLDMIEELNAVGLEVASDIDSDKLQKLHSKIFGAAQAKAATTTAITPSK